MANLPEKTVYNYIPVITTDKRHITLQARNIVGYEEDFGDDVITIYTTGGFKFQCFNDHEDYPYDDTLAGAIDDAICNL